MNITILAATILSLASVTGAALADPRPAAGTGQASRDAALYDHDRPDPRHGNYRAERYYVEGRQYSPRQLGSDDRIYRGGDGAYYCRHADGTTGRLTGALGDGLLDKSMAPGESKTLGEALGGISGAVLSQSVDQNTDDISCQ